MDSTKTPLRFIDVAHLLDHLFMLIFPTAALATAAEFGASHGAMAGLALGGFVAFWRRLAARGMARRPMESPAQQGHRRLSDAADAGPSFGPRRRLPSTTAPLTRNCEGRCRLRPR